MSTAHNVRPRGSKPKKRQPLRGWYQDLGFRWTWLQERTGLPYPSLTSWGSSNRRIPEEAKAKIAAALGIQPDQITN